MSLTPKDWQKFQHYKDRSPPWIKLHRTLLDNADFQRLPVASRALAPMLWLLAAEYEGGCITASNADIAWRLRMSTDEFDGAVNALIEKGFFDCEGDACNVLAARKQDAMPETEEETEKEEEADTRAKRPVRAPSRFDDFWKAYPGREGPNPRKPAEQKFDGLVKTGIDPEFLIAEVAKFAAAELARGNVGTRFIPQAVTWLNQQRWSDHAAVKAAAALAGDAEPDWNWLVAFWAKSGRWMSRNAGPEPGMTGCRVPVEFFAKHGLGLDGRKLQQSEAA